METRYEKHPHPLYNNQICVRVHKEVGSEFFILNKDAMFLAMKSLSKSGFELYLYIVSNKEEYQFGLGYQPVLNKTGMSQKSYQRAVQELKEKGYLKYNNTFVKASNGITAPKWDFYCIP